jgi:hypothetical protein
MSLRLTTQVFLRNDDTDSEGIGSCNVVADFSSTAGVLGSDYFSKDGFILVKMVLKLRHYE